MVKPAAPDWRPRVATALGVGTIVGVLIALSVLIPNLSRRSSAPQHPRAPSPRTTSASSLTPPGGPGHFHGKTRRVDSHTVIPITFADGTTAEVVYPASTPLGTHFASPRAYVRGPRACESQVTFTRSDIVGGLIRSGPPLAVFQGAGGNPVALWKGKRGPWDILAFDFGPWVAALFCEADPTADAEALSIWARNFDARVRPDGFLVLSLHPPLRLLQGNQAGPSVEWWKETKEPSNASFVSLTVAGCAHSALKFVPRWTVHRCFEGGIELYASGNLKFLRVVAQGLQLRSVSSPA